MRTKLAVVSGATGGIGAAVAHALWDAGYALLCLGRNPIQLNEARTWYAEHPRPGQDAVTVSLDLGIDSDRRLLTPLLYKQRPTLLAVCHGASPQPCSADEAEKPLRQVFEVDVIGTLALCTAVGGTMLENHDQGSIVVVSSAHARATYPARLPYSTCKAALSGMVRSLALEYAPSGITVNTIVPWQVAGTRTAQVALREGTDTLPLYLAKSPLRRLVEPQDVAKTILWLAECPSVAGVEILVDCGVGASMWHRPFEKKS